MENWNYILHNCFAGKLQDAHYPCQETHCSSYNHNHQQTYKHCVLITVAIKLHLFWKPSIRTSALYKLYFLMVLNFRKARTLPQIKQHTPSNVTPSSKSLFWQLYANIMSFQRAPEFFLCAFYHVHFISYTLLIQWYHRRFVSSLGGSRIPWVGERCLCSFVYLLFYYFAICIFTVLFCINRIWAVYADSSYTYM